MGAACSRWWVVMTMVRLVCRKPARSWTIWWADSTSMLEKGSSRSSSSGTGIRTRASDVRKARRNTRMAWIFAAMVVAGAGVSLEMVWKQAVDARLQVEGMMGAVHRMSATNVSMAADRIRLDGELAQARAAIGKAREELAVERNIEDTLLKAAIRKRDGLASADVGFADGQ